MKKKWIATVLSMLVTAAVLAGCGQKEQDSDSTAPTQQEKEQEVEADTAEPEAENTAQEDSVKIGYYGIATTEAFFKDIYDGLAAACEARGWELIADFTYYDPVKMRSAYDNFKAQEVDFIIDGNATEDVCRPFAEEAAIDGIPYLGLHINLDEPAYTYGSDNEQMGWATGEYIAKLIADEWDGKVDVVVEVGTFTQAPLITPRITSPKIKMAEFIDTSGIEVVQVDASGTETQLAYQQVMDVLTAHPDAKLAIFCNTDDLANSVYSAVQAAGRNDDCMITGSDCVEVSTAHFKECHDSGNTTDAWRGSIYLGPITYGETLCDMVEQILAGEEVPHENYVTPRVCGIDNLYEFFPELEN